MGSFYERVRTTFGHQVVQQMKLFSITNKKLAAQRNRRIFLLECKRCNVVPNFIERNTHKLWNIPQHIGRHNTPQLQTLSNQVNSKLLRITIRDTNSFISKLESKLNNITLFLQNSLPFHVIDEFFFWRRHNYNTIFNKIKKMNIKKLKFLVDGRKNLFNIENAAFFKNISNIQVPNNVQGFLALGPKFGLPVTPKDIDVFKLITEVECIISNIPETEQDLARSKATNLITNYIHFNSHLNCSSYSLEKDTKKFLKDNPNLIITQSDKGNVTVAMLKSSYIEKSLDLLDDITTYKRITRDPTNSLETSCNKLIKNLKDKGFISDVVAKSLYKYNGLCPKYYGLPKVHKPEIPLRPIVSCVGASTQPLAKFISEILCKSFSSFNKFRIKDTFEFAEKINNFQLPEGFVIVSFDVVSLFTNIPLYLILDIFTEHFDLIQDQCNIPKDDFLNVITYLYNNTYFSFNHNFYQQIKGLPMGGATSPTIAEIVMNKLLYYITDTIDFQLPFLYQYVDDLLTAVPRDKVDFTLNIFNSYNPNLVFTVERETNSSVPFLDTLAIRNDDNVICLDWYRKTTSSGRYIPFSSYHPKKQKINAVLALKDRIEKISHPSFLQKNLLILKKLLLNNKYPLMLLNKLLFSNNNHTIRNNNILPSQSPVKYAKLQYIENLTPSLKKIFSPHNIIIANYNSKKLKSFYSNLKDSTPTTQKSGIIYGLPCECGLLYVGQTGQRLSKRLTGHKSDCKNKPMATSLSIHVNRMDHKVQYANAVVLDAENSSYRRKLLEMCYITTCGNTLNHKKDVDSLSSIYTYLLHQKYTKRKKLPDCFSVVGADRFNAID